MGQSMGALVCLQHVIRCTIISFLLQFVFELVSPINIFVMSASDPNPRVVGFVSLAGLVRTTSKPVPTPVVWFARLLRSIAVVFHCAFCFSTPD